MKSLLHLTLPLLASCLIAQGAIDQPTNQPMEDQQDVPDGYESFFPKGYTIPKMAVGNGAVGIVGPVPFFNKREVRSSKVQIQNTQVGNPTSNLNYIQQELNQRDENTDLMIAATTGDLPAVERLLQKGSSVNSKNKFGSTALMGAAAAGQREIVGLLLKYGADPNAKGKDGATALTFASKNGHSEVAAILLNAGAKVSTEKDLEQAAPSSSDERGFTDTVNRSQNEEKADSIEESTVETTSPSEVEEEIECPLQAPEEANFHLKDEEGTADWHLKPAEETN